MQKNKNGAFFVSTGLNKEEYIQFLQFCKKKNMSKYAAIQEAIYNYCQVTPIIKRPGSFSTVEEDLEELLK